jgi:protein TonB
VTSAGAPRLSGGIAASVLLHAGFVAAVIFLGAPRREAPLPPMYRVQLVAAPAGDRGIGVVQPEATPTPPPPKPTPVPKAVPKNKPPVVKAKPTPPSKAVTPVPAQKTPAPKTDEPQPKAGGGVTGGQGADVANVNTAGIEFPYPGYLQNIAREIINRFQSQQTRLTLVADVRFMIKRDGTVDPNSISLAKSSGNYAFDQKALGAVEAAAGANRFGPLPAGFREDILPVIFRFTPALR